MKLQRYNRYLIFFAVTVILALTKSTIGFNIHPLWKVDFALLFLLYISLYSNPYFIYYTALIVGIIYDLLPYAGSIFGFTELFYSTMLFLASKYMARRTPPKLKSYLFLVCTFLVLYVVFVSLVNFIVYRRAVSNVNFVDNIYSNISFFIYNFAGAFIVYGFCNLLNQFFKRAYEFK